MEEETHISQHTVTEEKTQRQRRSKRKLQYFAQVATGCTIIQDSGIVLCNTSRFDDACLILPSKLTKEHNQFSIKILKSSKHSTIRMGLVPKDYNHKAQPGDNSKSIGYSSDGSIFIESDHPKTETDGAGENDVVALVLDMEANKVYFQKNTNNAFEVNFNLDGLGLYPCITVEHAFGAIQILEDDFWAPNDSEVSSFEPPTLPTKKFEQLWISPAERITLSECQNDRCVGLLVIHNPKKVTVVYQIAYGTKEEHNCRGCLKEEETWLQDIKLKKDELLEDIKVEWTVLPSASQLSNDVSDLTAIEESVKTFKEHFTYMLHVERKACEHGLLCDSILSETESWDTDSDEADFIEERTEKDKAQIPGDKDLLTYLKEMTTRPKKETDEIFNTVTAILKREAESVDIQDENDDTPLHLASTAQFIRCVRVLLYYGADPLKENKKADFPVKIAIDKANDKMARMFCNNIEETKILRLFWSSKLEQRPKLLLATLVEKKLKKTTLAVLETLRKVSIHKGQELYNLAALELDKDGRDPAHDDYQAKDMTAFQMLAIQESKKFGSNAAVKMLTDRKWDLYARKAFSIMGLIYLASLFSITYAAIAGVSSENVAKYNSRGDVARAVFEIISFIFALFTAIGEVMQMKSHKLRYFKDVYNYIEFPASILIMIVLPLRFAQSPGQWYTFAIGYILWVFRIFKYAALFKSTGLFAHILLQLIIKDVPKFVILFFVILLAFSGGLALSLKGDNNLMVHDETSSFWNILFVGVRILAEAQPVVEYAGPDGFRPVSCILMLLLLFATCVLLLNIFIAQLSSRYQAIQTDAMKELERTRARIVARIELKEEVMIFYTGEPFVKKYFKEYDKKDIDMD